MTVAPLVLMPNSNHFSAPNPDYVPNMTACPILARAFGERVGGGGLSAWREGWRESVLGVLRYYTERTPGAYVESRECSYPAAAADGELGALHAASLVSHLEGLLANLPLEVRA
ncbi:hypothetical protein T492DRAFT_850983 [Pavlovales sp. CCMP2436]|nr:hypothetical protein T492DRAFT_850983 [Pavlovales sp. CCMP2436]